MAAVEIQPLFQNNAIVMFILLRKQDVPHNRFQPCRDCIQTEELNLWIQTHTCVKNHPRYMQGTPLKLHTHIICIQMYKCIHIS